MKRSQFDDIEKTVDLIRGLKLLSEAPFISRAEILLKLTIEILEGESFFDKETAVESCFWLLQILDKLRQVIESQDNIIKNLKACTLDGNKLNIEQTFDPDPERIKSLQSLAGIFSFDSLTFCDQNELGELKAWAIAKGFDFDNLKELFRAD